MSKLELPVADEDGRKIRYFNNSEVQSWKWCRRNWELAYHRRLEPAVDHADGPLYTGGLFHLALERYYGYGEDPLSVLPTEFASDRQEKDVELIRIMLEGYLEWVAETGIDEDWETVAVEEHLAVRFGDVLDVPVRLVGHVDLRRRRISDPTDVRFFDHKSCASLEEDLHPNEQLLTYALMDFLRAREVDPECRPPFSGGVLNKARKVKRTSTAKPPFYARQEVPVVLQDLRDHHLGLREVFRDVISMERRLDGAGEDPTLACYPSRGQTCGWRCDWEAVCVMMSSRGDYPAYLSDNYRPRGDR